MPGFEGLCEFVFVCVYVWLCKEEKEKKELEKNWGCDGYKFHVCGGGRKFAKT